MTRARGATVEVRDYNGEGRWTHEAIVARYLAYHRAHGTTPAAVPSPREHTEGGVRWVYPVMVAIIEGIERGDPACVELGLDFIEEDQRFPFGRTLKSNTARALRRAPLDQRQIARVRRRVIGMLLAGHVPREFKQYAKLLRRVGVGPEWAEVERKVDRTNPYVMRWFNALRAEPLRRG